MGLVKTLFIMLKAPSPHLLFSSGVFTFYILMRQIYLEVESAVLNTLGILVVLVILNFIYIHQEYIHFKMWKTLLRNTDGLLRFKELIQIFPNEVIVLDKVFLDQDRPLYCNQAAQKLLQVSQKNNNESANNIGSLSNINIKNFLDKFEIEVILGSLEINQEKSIDKRKNLKEVIFGLLESEPSVFKEFNNYIAIFDNKNSNNSGTRKLSKGFKFEVKIGWIAWGEEPSLICIFNDVSKSEKIRELKILDKNKDKLLATVSHELRTPLHGITGMIDIVHEELPKELTTLKEYLEIAKSSARNLLLMINDILDISLIQRGTLRLVMETRNISDVIQELLPLVEIQALKKGLKFEYENSSPQGTKVSVDPIRLQQILMNLLGNAIKFTKEGGAIKLRITFEAKPAIDSSIQRQFEMREMYSSREFAPLITSKTPFDNSTNNNENYFQDFPLSQLIGKEEVIEEDQSISFSAFESKIKISVEDSGCGIAAENLPRIFHMFSKCEQVGFQAAPGVGLGLAISQNLVKRMGSKGIQVESVLGEGSTFSFELAADCDEDNELIKRGKVSEEPVRNPPPIEFLNTVRRKGSASLVLSTSYNCSKNILVVDDDHLNHLVIDLYLKSLNPKVNMEKAFNGLEAVNLIKDKANTGHYFNLVIMDCDMPVMNGFEATRRILNLVIEGSIPALKVVALTANASNNDKEQCLANGMIDVWTKPMGKQEFIVKLTNILYEL